MAAPIRSILVAGNGIDAWLSAAMLRHRLRDVGVTVVPVASPHPAPADLYAGSRPSLRRVLERLGVVERNLLAHTDGVLRLGQRYERWSAGAAGFSHCFGEFGSPIGGAPFHQAWYRDRHRLAPFAAHSLAAALADSGKFAEPTEGERFLRYDYGYNLDPARFRDYLRALALHHGVTEAPALLDDVTIGQGRIKAVRLADGSRARADLYIDCSGSGARLLTALPGGEPREDWSRWLRADRIIASNVAPDLTPCALDHATADADGWHLDAPLRSRTIRLAFRCSDGAADMGGVPMAQGRRTTPWIGNCLALGDAATVLEPLGAPNFHLLARSVDRLIRFLPDTDFAAVEIAEYNRKAANDADLARDFVILHHALARRPEAFWRPIEPPPALAHMLALFRERGKIPARDGDPAGFEDWLAVLIGHGVLPAQIDPALDTVSSAEIARASATICETIARIVAGAPTHRRYLERLLSGAAPPSR